MSKRMQQLVEDAKKAGYVVSALNNDSGSFTISKEIGRWRKPSGLMIYANGTAFDLSVRLDHAKGLRSYADMRKVLGI